MDHDTRITALEGTNPEALAGLTDVLLTVPSNG